MKFPVDIVIPVWNHPFETRASLACLVEHSPTARIIMVNNGSERETERILEEFAESLDERSILVSAERNVGRIAALNRGLALADAPLAIIVQEGISVSAGWLEPILALMSAQPDAGLVVPLPGRTARSAAGQAPPSELDHGYFGFMAIRRELHAVSGGFDEEMDAGIWTLRDYSRRAERFGYRTFSCPCSAVKPSEPQELGSVGRREERSRSGELSYCHRWGEEQEFCLVFDGSEADFLSQAIMAQLLTASRQGSKVSCIVGNKLHKWLQRNNLLWAHQNLHFEKLPIVFARRALLGRINLLAGRNPAIVLVHATPDAAADVGGISAAEFSRILAERHAKYYC